MPTNFTQSLETVKPGVTINQKVENTEGATAAAQAVAQGFASIMGMIKQEKEDALVGDFATDVDNALERELTLQDQTDLERAQLAAAHKEGLRKLKEAGADQEIITEVEKDFYRKMEQIDLREVQQGISLNSNRRALIRQYKANHPELSERFDKALSSNKALEEVRTRARAELPDVVDKVAERQALAFSLGSTPEALNHTDRVIKEAAGTTAKLQSMLDNGEINRYAWQGEINALSAQHFSADIGRLAPSIMRVSRGEGSVADLKLEIGAAKDQAINSLIHLKQTLEAESEANGTPMRLDIKEEQQRLEDSYNFLLNIVSTDDLRNQAQTRELFSKEARIRLLADMYDVPFVLAEPFMSTFVEDINNWVKALETLSSTSVSVVQEGLVGTTNEATGSIRALKTQLRLRGSSFIDPNRLTDFTPDEKATFFAAMTMLRQDGRVPDDLAPEAAPLLQRYFTNAYNAAKTPAEKERAATASARVVIKETDPNHPMGENYDADLANPRSSAVRTLKEQPEAFRKEVVRETGYVITTLSETNVRILNDTKFDPSKGFYFQPNYRPGERAPAQPPKYTHITRLQRLYNSQVEIFGADEANKWANQIMDAIAEMVKHQQPEEVKDLSHLDTNTSNQ